MRSPMLHHGVAYSCLKSDEAKVEALPNLGPYDRLKQGMLCEQFFMVSCHNSVWPCMPLTLASCDGHNFEGAACLLSAPRLHRLPTAIAAALAADLVIPGQQVATLNTVAVSYANALQLGRPDVCCLVQMLASNMTPWQAPAVAALPFGANSTRYVALELHYNNPDALQGQRDPGSGIR